MAAGKRRGVFLIQKVLFNWPVMSNSSQPHGLQHSRPLCPSPSPRRCPSSCSLHQWCHPAISSSDTLFSICPQSFPASGTFPMSQLFPSDDQNTGVSVSAWIFPMSIQGWFPYNCLVWSPCCPINSQESFPAPQFEGINSSALHFTIQLSQPYVTTGKTIALTIWIFANRITSLLFNTV